MVKLLILGAAGSMGQLISKLALEDNEIEVIAACDVNNIGQPLENLVGANDPNAIKISDINQLQDIIEKTKPEVAVDFSIAKATEKNSKICVKNKIKCVIGTTGLSQEFLEEFGKLVSEYQAPAVISSNMATGVNILFKTVSILTSYLKDWDIEIIEAHHHRKLDAPSGTALTLGKIIGEGIGSDFHKIAKFGRELGPNKRLIGAKNEIGVHSIRAGDIVGDHIILYAGPGERIELKHQAHNRNCFASGAITAIKFIANAQENKIYNTREVLGL
ncbi:MAG: 4-hydroxy-tetrahydrodipicolinate reductase [Promethearchaeota archaeon]|nr:MAG: 4-hydroxy-tetrahydrodipicolinate reductase [Candidatus Lokiarchaeota archaeon]